MVKVERSFPAPASLDTESQKENGSYSEPDVIERLKKDFHNKCYICEMNGLQDPQIEHLLPHKNGKFKDRKFDWNNLFWSCGHCNSVKNQNKYETGILDCCKEDPEAMLCFKLENSHVNVYARDKNNAKAVLTAQLVMDVFHLQNTGMRVYKSNHRFQELNREMNKLYDALDEVAEHPESRFALNKARALLRKESRFAAFKRYYVREKCSKSFFAEMLKP